MMTVLMAALLVILFFTRRTVAVESFSLTVKSAVTMLGILPPILLIVNLLDEWIPRETIVRHMGDNAGMKGYFWAFLLGTFAAGPLYAAFPVAALLAKKGARMAYLIFLLGTWTTTKLPIFMYELSFFGVTFTAVHVLTGLTVCFLFSLLMEKILLKKRISDIYAALSEA